MKEFKSPSPFIMAPKSKAPYFSSMAIMPDNEVKTLSINDPIFAGKFIILMFYLGDWTRICLTELRSYSARKKDFDDLNSEMIFCSTDSHFSHLSFLTRNPEKGGLGAINYPLLGDRCHSIARSYGVLSDDEGLAFRATFIIDPSKVIRQILIHDHPIGRDVEETLRSVAAFNHVRINGGLCPANWQPTHQPEETEKAGNGEFLKAAGVEDRDSTTIGSEDSRMFIPYVTEEKP